jgi:hypothetical protein
MSIEEQLIAEIKLLINTGNLDELKKKWNEYRDAIDFGREIAWDYVFQKVYLHAALKKQRSICEWLNIIFQELDPVSQIALRHTFSYAKHLLNKH